MAETALICFGFTAFPRLYAAHPTVFRSQFQSQLTWSQFSVTRSFLMVHSFESQSLTDHSFDPWKPIFLTISRVNSFLCTQCFSTVWFTALFLSRMRHSHTLVTITEQRATTLQPPDFFVLRLISKNSQTTTSNISSTSAFKNSFKNLSKTRPARRAHFQKNFPKLQKLQKLFTYKPSKQTFNTPLQNSGQNERIPIGYTIWAARCPQACES